MDFPEAEPAFPEGEPENTPRPDHEPTEQEPTEQELFPEDTAAAAFTMEDAKLKAVLEAIIYVTDEPLSLEQICTAIEQPRERVIGLLEQLTADYERPERGLSIREVAGGFTLSTKAEHHEEVRRFVKNLNPPLKLSLPALETLAVVAYKQPITAPEIMEIRGVQGAGVLKTLLDRKLIATGGRKQVIGKPILYKTTREFLVQFGLKDLSELPSLKEFQEIGRLDMEMPATVTEMPGASIVNQSPANEPPDFELPVREPPAETPTETEPGEEDPPTGDPHTGEPPEGDPEPGEESPPVQEPPDDSGAGQV